MAKQKNAMESHAVIASLRQHFCPPRYGFLEQVANGTGMNAGRWIDAIAFSLWPSMGLEAHAIEVKISRNDWRRERDDPAKADAIGKYCHRFWIAAPKGIVPVEEVPPTWGLIEVEPPGSPANLKVVRGAGQLTPHNPTWEFVMAILRRASDADQRRFQSMIQLSEVEHRVEAGVERGIKERVVSATRNLEQKLEFQKLDYDRLKAAVAEFEARSGLTITQFQSGRIGDAVRALQTLGDTDISLAHIRRAMANHKALASQLENMLSMVGRPLTADDIRAAIGDQTSPTKP